MARGVVILILLAAGTVDAESLSQRLGVFQPGFVTITPAILELQRALARATDFPATTTTPGIIYRFDPSAGAFERVAGPLGPAFLERAETVGEGRFDLAASYLYARFTRFDGESLSEQLSSRFVAVSGDLVVPQRVETRDFSLTSHVMYFSATYGVTGDADVNLLMPVYYTAMDGKRRFSVVGQAGQFESLDADAFGPGDLLLRAKYRFLDRNTWGLAAGLTLHFPTGNEDNFQGIGDMVVTPSIVASWQSARWDVHGSFGVDINAGDLNRSGVRYGVGASFAALDCLTLLADLVGTSGFASDDVTFFVPDPRLVTIRGEFDPPIQARAVGNGTQFLTTLEPENVVDLAVGFKVILVRDLVWFTGVIVPLTTDGARANVMPTGGFQYEF
jgi:outer membrane putative beta-barrel porin/alpha-amylase